MWALALVLAGLPLKVETRPGGDPKDAVAQITLGNGKVTISTGKASFPAKVGYVLAASDSVEVAADAWVTLALKNDHVVRLDDELTVKVESLAMLKASRQTRTYKEQLDALVTPGEQEGALRLAGWHATVMAANVPSTVASSDDLMDLDEAVGGPRKEVSRSKKQDRPPAETREKTEEQRPEPGEMAQKTNAPRAVQNTAPVVASPPSPGAAPAPPPPPSAPPPRPAFALDPELTSCVEGQLKPLGPEFKKALGANVTLKARRKSGALQVRLGVGLAPSACVIAWVKQREVTTEWQLVVVPLR